MTTSIRRPADIPPGTPASEHTADRTWIEPAGASAAAGHPPVLLTMPGDQGTLKVRLVALVRGPDRFWSARVAYMTWEIQDYPSIPGGVRAQPRTQIMTVPARMVHRYHGHDYSAVPRVSESVTPAPPTVGHGMVAGPHGWITVRPAREHLSTESGSEGRPHEGMDHDALPAETGDHR